MTLVVEPRRFLHDNRGAFVSADEAAAVAAGSSLGEAVRACERVSFRRTPQDDVVHRPNVEKVYADRVLVGVAGAWTRATRS